MSVSIELATVGDGAQVLVAVKRATNEEAIRRLTHEAACLRAAQCPGVVELVGYQHHANGSTLRTAYGGNHSLATIGPLPLAIIVALATRLATTLAELHRRGLVHGRIEPSHVLVDAQLVPRLCGFAGAVAARAPDDANAGGALAPLDGSRAPVPPPNAAADVLALGRLVGTLLVPLVDPHAGAREEGAADWSLRPLTPRLPQPLRQLLDVVLHATAADPRHRPSAASFAASLGALHDARAPKPGARPPARRGRPSRQRRALAHLPFRARPDRPRPPLIQPVAGLRVGQPHDPVDPVASHLNTSTRPARRARRVAPLLGGIAAITATVVAVGLVLRGPNHRSQRSSLGPPSTSPPSATTGGDTAEAAAPTMVTAPASCPEIVGAVATADVDGNGCVETIELVDRNVIAGNTQFALGQPGDRVALGDWDCDGGATAAIFRPSTGEVFVFSAWPSASPGSSASTEAMLSERTRAIVRTGSKPIASDPDGDGCADLLIERIDGLRVEVPT